MKHHPMSPNGLDDVSKNNSGNQGLEGIIQERISRRTVLKGSLVLAASSFMGISLTGCGGDDASATTTSTPAAAAFSLGFSAVSKSVADALSIPTGYTHKVLFSLGDPINSSTSTYANDGTESGSSFNYRAGDHHDGMIYFGLNSAGAAKDSSSSTRGLLCMNHENITQLFLHTASEVAAGLSAAGRLSASQIDKEVNAHGVSIIEVAKSGSSFEINKSSSYNKRVTATTEMDIYGAAKGNALIQTKFSPTGVKTRGTLNNCASNMTPWGTYLTCEENWAGYFKTPASSTLGTKEKAAQERYIGSSASNGSYGWANPPATTTDTDGLYTRWNIIPTGASATEDYRNAANNMGWVVELDPYNPSSTPRKRTTMGRFAHETASPAKAVVGKPVVFYMGDDARSEYVYKYVSNKNWEAADATTGGLATGDKYLDDGKLYVAKFNSDGTGTWIELTISNSAIATYSKYTFANQGDVAINSRLAADAVGATHMDRPEWLNIHPVTGDIYVTLTNNSNRGKTGSNGMPLDPANPRYYTDAKGSSKSSGNVNGHIMRMQENGGDNTASAFKWDIYLFGAQADADPKNINLSSLTNDNDFSSPDGLAFSQAKPGLMWIQTDDGAYTDVTNCMMLAALPGSYGDGASVSITNTAVPNASSANQTITTYMGKAASTSTLKRFLVGPKGCEITGIAETPDGKTIFVNIQHPGEDTSTADIANPTNYQSHWPKGGSARPQSSTIVITKDDGGIVGS